jgi:hypothetical protein
MKNLYNSLYVDIKKIKRRAVLFALLITVIYGSLTFGISSPSSTLQITSIFMLILAGVTAGVIAITIPQHGMQNQKSIIYSAYTLFIVLVLTAIQGLYAISQGDGLIEHTYTRDASGNMISAELHLQPFILMTILAIIWITSLAISNKIERKQKSIKGIQNNKLFK